MHTLLLLSVLVATVVIPALAAREASALSGLKKLLVAAFGFSVAYWLIVMFFVSPA
jgi:hypothetical protein